MLPPSVVIKDGTGGRRFGSIVLPGVQRVIAIVRD
jgi:hypothetical protein